MALVIVLSVHLKSSGLRDRDPYTLFGRDFIKEKNNNTEFHVWHTYQCIFTINKTKNIFITMIKLPKIKRDPKETEGICQCRPVCKSRRREWKGHVQNTSAELLLERKPVPECIRRWPTKVYPNGPCPLLGRTRRITINERNVVHVPHVVRICQAPVDTLVDIPYLKYTNMAKRNGALGAVNACCACCECGACCPCGVRDYVLHDEERAARRRDDMRAFDTRVHTDHQEMRIMYDYT